MKHYCNLVFGPQWHPLTCYVGELKTSSPNTFMVVLIVSNVDFNNPMNLNYIMH